VVIGGVVALERVLRGPDVSRRRNAPRTALADAGDAMDVRLEGTVEVLDGRLREGPVSGLRCVYYEHTVRGDHQQSFHRSADGVPFILRDPTGYAIIDPEGATALLVVRDRGLACGSRELLDALDPMMSRRERLVGEEALICPGDRLAVIGRGVRVPDPDPSRAVASYRYGAATRLRVTHSAQFPLHLLDPDRKV
jgi:hypothetical protein